MNEEELKEKYALSYNWEKVNGFKVDCETLDYGEFAEVYIDKEEFDNMIEPATFWREKDSDNEMIFTDIDELLDEIEDAHIEDENFITFEKFKEKNGN